MKIMVTGGAGFVGSHLVDRLMAEGHEVICVDNLYTGVEKNLSHWTGNSRFTFVKQDIAITIPPFQCDQIYNLACAASPVHYQALPIDTFKTSVIGMLNALECAKLTGARVLQASTSEVYGDPAVHPQPETYWGNVNPIGIRSCYDEGKRGAETLCFDFERVHNVEIRVARIFNTYGPRMLPNDGRVVSNFIVQALQGNPLTVYGNGLQTRSFCFVSDLVDGLIRLMNHPQNPGPMNLGNPGEFTMNELAQQVLALTKSTSSIEFHPLPQDDPKVRRPNITNAQSVLKWSPTIPLSDGLPQTIRYFRDRLT